MRKRDTDKDREVGVGWSGGAVRGCAKMSAYVLLCGGFITGTLFITAKPQGFSESSCKGPHSNIFHPDGAVYHTYLWQLLDPPLCAPPQLGR